jgi:glycosyltransferase involved in cell wall biosynthesis
MMNTHTPRAMVHESPRIGVFVSFSGTGGVERMILNLTRGFVNLGAKVDMIPVRQKSIHLGALPPGVNVVDLGSSHTLSSLPGLVRYLRAEQPDALLAAKDRANSTAVLARRLARVPIRLVLRMGTTVSAAMAESRPLKERIWYLRMRMLYPSADAVVAVSNGVAEDLKKNAGLSPSLLRVIPNPVITPELISKAQEPLDHPWFKEGAEPVLLGVGRLTRQKDFPTLLRAFALVRKNRSCHLMILGEGRNRAALKTISAGLGIRDDVAMPGFMENPYPYMNKAALFVLSSRWEGSPNVLTEALALGTPVVSTDCPSGPKEILDHGRFGPLVPMGEPDAMAHAILTTLDAPLEKSLLKSAVRAYTVEESSRKYLKVLLGEGC